MKHEKPMKAVCPRCHKEHYIVMYWTGNGHPKKFCPVCRLRVDQYESRTIVLRVNR